MYTAKHLCCEGCFTVLQHHFPSISEQCHAVSCFASVFWLLFACLFLFCPPVYLSADLCQQGIHEKSHSTNGKQAFGDEGKEEGEETTTRGTKQGSEISSD